ncbi:uncharacterized protein with TBP-like fold DUF4468 [Gelidibacter sediminis]|uniref:Uncharacterized protein with TBP-like fold DUF4468 n=1 Tax=Gelidibacter sediminis TaxID=1608710 RepID=A0A4V3F9W7_9FLAO|nr:DUF4468 domain-containing protein [Gelidibacter sediminis]TDU43486.1 uncharacterized protein with TBP-like fold DUF4468 [Gelidibacter sediminis]
MKVTTILTFILIGFIGNAQVVVDSINAKIYVDRVQEIELDKNELQEKTNRWVAKNYNNSKYVTRINNEDNILIKGAFDVGADFSAFGATLYSERKVEYTLDLKFKDGKYKIDISDLLFDGIDATRALSVYFMSYDEYKTFSLKAMEEYDGMGKKAAIKRINNDDKFRKDYESQQNYGKKIIPQIVDKLSQIDLSLLSYLKNQDMKDEW